MLNGLADIPAGKVAAIVTHLEMLARPEPELCPVPDGCALRGVPHPTVAWYRDLYRRVGALDWLWFSRLALTDEALSRVLDNPQIEIYALSYRGKDEGLVQLDFQVPGACELAYFGVTPGLIGKGVGRFMISRATGIAWAREIGRFHVHTCTLDHPGALGFYRRAGFVPMRQQVEIADDPRLIGLLPETAAPHVPIFRR